MCILLAFVGFLLSPDQGVKFSPLKTGSHSGKDAGTQIQLCYSLSKADLAAHGLLQIASLFVLLAFRVFYFETGLM